MKKILTIAFAAIFSYVALSSCGSLIEPSPDTGADTGRLHAEFDAYGYQLDHDVYDGLVER